MNISYTYSFCIASSGRVSYLNELVASIEKLNIASFEILIGSYNEIDASIFANNVKVLKTPQHIGKTRNALKAQASGQWLVFLDEDVSFNDLNFIQTLQYLESVHRADIYAGFYGNKTSSTLVDRAYNMTCNLWVQRGQLTQSNVLGGLYILKGKCFPGYFDAFSFGGEEYPYFNSLVKKNYKIITSDKLSVSHSPKHTLRTFFKRAWLHGKYKPKDGIKGRRFELFFKYQESLQVKTLAGFYFLVVYISHFFNSFTGQLQHSVYSKELK